MAVKIGRPSKGKDARTNKIPVKASLNEIERWKQAASREGVSLAVWLRNTLNIECSK